MAFCYPNSPILALFLLPTIIFLVQADETLNQRMCNESRDAPLCLACLNKPDTNQIATEIQVIQKLEACATDSLNYVVVGFRNNAMYATDPVYKKFYDQCVQILGSALEQDDILRTNILYRKFDGAIKTINEKALPFLNQCVGLATSTVGLPSDVAGHLSDVYGYYGILVQLLKTQ